MGEHRRDQQVVEVDERFPVHGLFKKVNPRTGTPIPATLLVLALGIGLMLVLPGDALLPLILVWAILMFVPYGMTIVLYLAVRSRLDRREGGWDLGRFEMPVAIVALLWVVVAIVVAIATSATIAPVLIVAGLVVMGGAYFVHLLTSRRRALEHEPGTSTSSPG
jgi:amino acid transporter